MKIIDQKHGSMSSRKRGVIESSGKYIWFVDDDDEIYNPVACEKLFNIFDLEKDIQIIQFAIYSIRYKVFKCVNKVEFIGKYSSERLQHYYYTDYLGSENKKIITPSVWSKIYDAKVVKETAFQVGNRFSALFDAVFLLLPLLLLGFFVSQKKISKKVSLIGFIVSFVLLTVEAFTLRAFGQESVSFIFMTFPTAYFLFSLISQLDWKLNGKVCSVLGASSLMIYCFHPMVIELFGDWQINSIVLFLITAIISIAVAIIYITVKSKLQNIRRKNSSNA